MGNTFDKKNKFGDGTVEIWYKYFKKIKLLKLKVEKDAIYK